MHANSAKCSEPISVSILVYDNVKLLDVTGPLQVFSDARREDGSAAYEITLVSVGGKSVTSDTTMPVIGLDPSELPNADTFIVAGGRGAFEARFSSELQAILRQASLVSRRIASVCLGAFILAEAGLLKGKRAATHWMECERLSEEYPDTTVMNDEIFVKDGMIWTSAGVTAGIDMALALVEEDLGRKEALRIARLLVLPIKRQGGQSQFSTSLRHQVDSSTGRFDALLTDIQEHPGKDYSVPTMARNAHMSERNFSRVFRSEFGKPPAQYVEQVRVEAARNALLDQSVPLKAAAVQFGFGSEENMRRAFKRQFGVTPTEILEQFSTS